MARYIGHLGSGRGFAKSTVQSLRQSDASGDHRSIHHLGLPAKGKSVPRNVSTGNGMLHSLAIVGCGLLEVLIEQPGTCRPDVGARTRLAHFLGHLDRLGEKLGEIPVNDRSLRVNKAGIEMTLEHDQDTLDLPIRRRLHGEGSALPGREPASQRDHRLDKFTTLHTWPAPGRVLMLHTVWWMRQQLARILHG